MNKVTNSNLNSGERPNFNLRSTNAKNAQFTREKAAQMMADFCKKGSNLPVNRKLNFDEPRDPRDNSKLESFLKKEAEKENKSINEIDNLFSKLQISNSFPEELVKKLNNSQATVKGMIDDGSIQAQLEIEIQKRYQTALTEAGIGTNTLSLQLREQFEQHKRKYTETIMAVFKMWAKNSSNQEELLKKLEQANANWIKNEEHAFGVMLSHRLNSNYSGRKSSRNQLMQKLHRAEQKAKLENKANLSRAKESIKHFHDLIEFAAKEFDYSIEEKKAAAEKNMALLLNEIKQEEAAKNRQKKRSRKKQKKRASATTRLEVSQQKNETTTLSVQENNNLSFGLSSSDSANFTRQILEFSAEANGQRPFARQKSTRDASNIIPEDEEEKPKTQVNNSSKKTSLNQYVTHLRAMKPIRELARVTARWEDKENLERIKEFNDWTQDGKRVHRYAEMTDEELAFQRKCHYMPETERIISDPNMRKIYSIPTERGIGLFAVRETKKEDGAQTEPGIIFFGLDETNEKEKVIFHKHFIAENELPRDKREALHYSMLPDYKLIRSAKEEYADWKHTSSYDMTFDEQTGILTISYFDEDFCLKIFPIHRDLLSLIKC